MDALKTSTRLDRRWTVIQVTLVLLGLLHVATGLAQLLAPE